MIKIRNTSAENQYADIIREIQKNGNISKDRTGVGTKRIQSTVIHSDLQKEFPILIGKKINFNNAFVELIWMLCGRTDVQWLRNEGVNYWNEWEGEDGTIGRGYGAQFRDFGADENGVGGFDQLADVVSQLQNNPDSRRAMISLWNPKDLTKTTLPPCHFLYHFVSYIDKNDGKRYLDLHTTQRSADFFLGVPYNLCMSGIFLTLMAKHVRMEVGSIHQTFADSHTYLNHTEQVDKYLENVDVDTDKLFGRKNYTTKLLSEEIIEDNINYWNPIITPINPPKLKMCANFESIKFTDFDDMLEYIGLEFTTKLEPPLTIENYVSYPFIKAKVAV